MIYTYESEHKDGAAIVLKHRGKVDSLFIEICDKILILYSDIRCTHVTFYNEIITMEIAYVTDVSRQENSLQ